MPRRHPAAVLIACLPVTACNFDAYGLAATTEVELTASSSSTGVAPVPGSTGPGSSTGLPEPGTSEGGESSSSSGEPACTEHCPPTPAWTVTTPGDAYALVLDDAGDAVVAGERTQTNAPATTDAWVAKFSGNAGHLAWETRHNGDQKGRDFARDVALTADGTVVVAGGSAEVEGRRTDVWVGWLAGDTGELLASSNLMTTDWNGVGVKLDEWAETLAIDDDNGLVVAGTRCAVPCDVPDAWIGRFTAAGVPVWDEPDAQASIGSFRGLVLDRESLLPFGTDGYDGSQVPWRSLIRRLDAEGAGTWSALPDPPQAEIGFVVLAGALAPDGGLWVVGREIVAGTDGGFIRLYQPGDADTPIVELGGGALAGELSAITLTGDGAPIVAGATGRYPGRSLWLGQFTTALAPLWRIDESSTEVNEARGIARDAEGGLLVLGVQSPADGPATTWLRRYSPAGSS